MSSIKNWYYQEFIEPEENPTGLTDMEEYELYVLFQKLKENMKSKEEIMDFFQPLWEEGE
jgi:hypothetical protein